MTAIGIEIRGERVVSLKFEEFPQQARMQLRAHIEEILARLDAEIRSRVPVKTGLLLSEIQSFLDETDDKIAGKVKVIGKSAGEYGKAAALEYGAHNSARVKDHLRRITTVYGHYISPIQAMISAYSRVPDIQEVDFMRGPLSAMQTEILAGLKAALDEAAAE